LLTAGTKSLFSLIAGEATASHRSQNAVDSSNHGNEFQDWNFSFVNQGQNHQLPQQQQQQQQQQQPNSGSLECPFLLKQNHCPL
jgi:hypothetical protein